jgi:hypothetical protein
VSIANLTRALSRAGISSGRSATEEAVGAVSLVRRLRAILDAGEDIDQATLVLVFRMSKLSETTSRTAQKLCTCLLNSAK